MLEDESRVIELTLRDDTGTAFSPSGANTTVYDSDDDIIISTQSASVSANKISTIIGTTTTNIPGTYKIKWEIKASNGSTFYHFTNLEVLDLL